MGAVGDVEGRRGISQGHAWEAYVLTSSYIRLVLVNLCKFTTFLLSTFLYNVYLTCNFLCFRKTLDERLSLLENVSVGVTSIPSLPLSVVVRTCR